jgi:hypothetical protein
MWVGSVGTNRLEVTIGGELGGPGNNFCARARQGAVLSDVRIWGIYKSKCARSLCCILALSGHYFRFHEWCLPATMAAAGDFSEVMIAATLLIALSV